MVGIVICLSAAAMGVDYGWQPVEGGIEYIIQIEPHLIESMKSGRDIFSDLPKTAQCVRSYRITVGTGRLPHQGEPPPDSAVVPAVGEEAASAEDQSGEENGVDLSQLPGPILRPALTMDQPDRKAAVEPRRLNDEMEPVENRAAYRQTTQSPKERTATDNSKNREKPATTSQAAKPNLHPVPQNKPTKTELKQPSDEAESPSDKKPNVPAVATTPSALQLGLFTSLACNAFLLWVAVDHRSRYRALMRRIFDGPRAAITSNVVDEGPRWEQLGEQEKPANSGAAEKSADAR